MSEEDGLDECIVPSDGKSSKIQDNELRRLLVDSLPSGTRLTAVFDSCHSASLLDLEHWRCNRVYVPWITKGKRRSNPKWNISRRKGAMVPRFGPRNFISPSCESDRRSRSGSSTPEKTTPFLSRRIFKTSNPEQSLVRPSRDEIVVSSASTLAVEASGENRDRQQLTIRRRSLARNERWFGNPRQPIRRCMSPEALWPCTGYCPRSRNQQDPRANVISFGACKESQKAWEDPDGSTSMTKLMIKVLREDPHPTLFSLLTRISHELHKFCLKLQETLRDRKRIFRLGNRRRVALGEQPEKMPSSAKAVNYAQDPQLCSLVPLGRDEKWNP